VVLDDGKIVASGTEDELGEGLLHRRRFAVTVRSTAADADAAPLDGAGSAPDGLHAREPEAVIRAVPGVAQVAISSGVHRTQESNAVTYQVDGDSDLRAPVCRARVEAGHDVLALARAERELERVFVGLVGGAQGAQA